LKNCCRDENPTVTLAVLLTPLHGNCLVCYGK